MSNCVQLENHVVRFANQEIDAKALLIFLEGLPPSLNDNMTGEQQNAWWFLATCTYYHSWGVEIRFGEGRSSHTHRDVRGVVDVLRPFMKKHKKHTFIARDESDGFQQCFNYPVVFGKEAEKPKPLDPMVIANIKRMAAENIPALQIKLIEARKPHT